jgi:hypothetical protein
MLFHVPRPVNCDDVSHVSVSKRLANGAWLFV